MIEYLNRPGMFSGLRREGLPYTREQLINSVRPEDRLAMAKEYLAEIGGARPGVLDRWMAGRAESCR
jgi:hypothetical protein